MDKVVNPLDRCTDRARNTLLTAVALGRQRGHQDVLGQDLLDALSHDGGIAWGTLQNLGYESPNLPTELPLVDSQAATNSPIIVELVTEAMKVTQQLSHRYIGGEHLLIALMRTQPKLVADPDLVTTEVLGILGHA